MSKKVAVFWPGDYRPMPNKLALPQMKEATKQMLRALKKIGRKPYLVLADKQHTIVEADFDARFIEAVLAEHSARLRW